MARMDQKVSTSFATAADMLPGDRRHNTSSWSIKRSGSANVSELAPGEWLSDAGDTNRWRYSAVVFQFARG